VRRREFITFLGGAAAWPVAARAQQRMRRVAMLSVFNDRDPSPRSMVDLTFQALSQLGWESGRNLQIIERWSAGDIDRTNAFAKELVASQPDVIFAVGSPATVALQRETRTIPIVFGVVSDPVGAGLVASLPRPGGNITGFSNSEAGFGGKLLSILRLIAPRIRQAAVMFNPDTAPARGLYHLGGFETAARSLGIEPITTRVYSDADIEQAIMSLGRAQGGLVMLPDAFLNVHRGSVIALTPRHRVPAIFDSTSFAQEGGLAQYGPDVPVMMRHLATYLDRILRSAKPGDLAVELPTKYDLVINLKTARMMGLDVSDDVLSTADKVIE
jgi:putative ABC transport system substrate-binding protein